MAENYAAVLHGSYDIRIGKIPMPIIKNNEVLIKIECVGICGSDIKLYSQSKCGVEVISKPMALGHEGAGTIVMVGSDVTSLKPGDRVAIDRRSLAGAVNFVNCSTIGTDGNLCKFYKHVADFCHKIPDSMSMEEGAAVQPLAIALHACNRANIKVGTKMAAKSGGTVLVGRISEGSVEVPLSETLLREVDIKGSIRMMNTYPAAIALVSNGTIDLNSFITHHYPLEDTKKALDHAKTGDAMKIIIHVQK